VLSVAVLCAVALGISGLVAISLASHAAVNGRPTVDHSSTTIAPTADPAAPNSPAAATPVAEGLSAPQAVGVPAARDATPAAPPTAPAAPQLATAPVTSSVYWPNCAAARSAHAAPILRGSPGYRAALDADDDGIACEVDAAVVKPSSKPANKPAAATTAPPPASTSPERVYPPCASGVYDNDDLSNIRCVVEGNAANSAPTAAEKTSASEPVTS
jgi:hypothetical protein